MPRDVDANLAALDAAAAEAKADGAGLIITPEMFITGYSIGDDIGRLAAHQPLERVGEIAARHGIAIVAGGPELVNASGKSEHSDASEHIDASEHSDASGSAKPAVANSAWLFDDTGAVLARHRKIQLFGDLDRAHFVAGDAPVTIATYRGLRIAMLVCFDVEYPEAVRHAALAGADLIAVPTAQMEPFEFVNEHLIRVRAWENTVYIAYANQTGPDGDFTYVGRSVIASPHGEHLAQAGPSENALLTAVVDPAILAAARAQNPYLVEVRRELFASRLEPTAR